MTDEVDEDTLKEFAELSADAGYIKRPFKLIGLVDQTYLNKK